MAVAQPKIGLFGALFNEEGKLLLKRRPEGISSPGQWDLPGGGVDSENNAKALDERIVREELAREVEEETSLRISLLMMPTMFPAVLGPREDLDPPRPGGTDWAWVIPVDPDSWEGDPTGEYRWLSPTELRELAEGPEDNRLVSGWGNRMCRLCLKAMAVASPNREYQGQAAEMLDKIFKEMGAK